MASDRKLPHCLLCEQTAQICDYPPGPLKPGPRIGSLRQRKRSRDGNKNNSDNHSNHADGDGDGNEERHTARPRLESPLLAQNSPSVNCSVEGEGIFLLTDGAHDPIPDMDTATTTAETKVPDLSFILHPSHETSRIGQVVDFRSTTLRRRQQHPTEYCHIGIDRACSVLGLERVKVEKLIEAYFGNMVAIKLFHQPSFFDKLGGITSPGGYVCNFRAFLPRWEWLGRQT